TRKGRETMSQKFNIHAALAAGFTALTLSTVIHAAGPKKLDVANTFNTNIFIGEGRSASRRS
ncbi:MAG: hypothetical protein SV429_11790, partial [Pseudomonadota bacterium]|nr:hypothetical protein [Pseudomonadota bacterium]